MATLVVKNIGEALKPVYVYDKKTRAKRIVHFSTYQDAEEARMLMESLRIDSAFEYIDIL